MAIEKKALEQIRAADDVSVKVELDLSPSRFYKIRVTAENGIFKNGRHYAKGDEAVIELRAAQRFEANGEVDILEEVLGYDPDTQNQGEDQ